MVPVFIAHTQTLDPRYTSMPGYKAGKMYPFCLHANGSATLTPGPTSGLGITSGQRVPLNMYTTFV